jgi:predicted phage gp36 major capsid-like protein
MTKQEIYQMRIEALRQKAEKLRDFTRETVAELKEDRETYLASSEQEKTQENKPKELV